MKIFLCMLVFTCGALTAMEKNDTPLVLRSLSDLMEKKDFDYNSKWGALSLDNKSLSDLRGISHVTIGQTHLGAQLQVLMASHNHLKKIPEEICQCTALKGLHIEDNEIDQLPDQIYTLTSLRDISLDNNNVTVLKSQVTNLTNLVALKIPNNKIVSLPCLSALTKLKILDLKNNKLTSLMAGNVFLIPTQLRSLDISGNRLAQIPAQINKFTDLNDLRISHSECDNQIIKWQLFKKLMAVSYAANLKTIPEGFEQLGSQGQNGLVINLSHNCFKDLPENFKSLNHEHKSLYLNLSSNCFDRIARVIPTMDQLVSLELCNNNIECIPVEIAGLTKLINLVMDSNKIRVLPDALFQCTSLVNLRMSGNQIHAVPPAISSLTGLRWLRLTNNRIEQLPTEIGSCLQLRTLALSNNQLTELPTTITNLVDLELLTILDNDLQLLKSIFNKSENKEIFDFIQHLRARKKVQYGNPVRVLPADVKREIYQHLD